MKGNKVSASRKNRENEGGELGKFRQNKGS